jgi:hypothetical protein
MDPQNSAAEMLPPFYVGEHSTKRTLPVSSELVHHAQDLGVSPALRLSIQHSPPLAQKRQMLLSWEDMLID